MATWVIKRSTRVYTNRKTTVRERIQGAWKRHNSAGGVWSFTINQHHTLIVSFLDKLIKLDKKYKNLGLASHFKDTLRLIENCLPLENIKTLMDEKTQSVNGGYTDAQEILDVALMVRDSMMSDGHTANYVIDTLKNTSPFNEYFSQIEDYFKKNPIERDS